METIQRPVLLLENALTEELIEGSIEERVGAGRYAGSAAAFEYDRRTGRLAGSDSVVLEELYGEMRDLCQPFQAVIFNIQVRKVLPVQGIVFSLIAKHPQRHFFKVGGRHRQNLPPQLLSCFFQRIVAWRFQSGYFRESIFKYNTCVSFLV